MLAAKLSSSLLILGHGSTENPDSSQPTWDLVDVIRQIGSFSSVHCAFWKEEPSFRQIFAAIEEDEIYVVPNFISEGYFTRQVLPRELELEGTTARRGGKVIHYCDPVGIHPSMTDLLSARAVEMLGDDTPLSETALIIVGHGTSLNEKSTESIKVQVERLKAGPLQFEEVLDAYMEEAPFIADWKTLTSASHVVVVPFFIADGLHSFQDIPVMLGIVAAPTAAASQMANFPENPHQIDGRRLYYSRAIGTAPSMAQVVLDQVAQFDLACPEAQLGRTCTSERSPMQLPDHLVSLISDESTRLFGEVLLSHCRKAGSFKACHLRDSDVSVQELNKLGSVPEVREMVKYCPKGKYRPLKTAPSMKNGWLILETDIRQFYNLLDSIYPAAFAGTIRYFDGQFDPVPLRKTLARQTGMYQFAKNVSDAQANQIMRETCVKGCLRKIAWPLDDQCTVSRLNLGSASTSIPIICTEACTFVVSQARRLAREAYDRANK